LFALLLVGCAGPEELVQNQYEEETTNPLLSSLTKASYAKVASQLSGWRPGEPWKPGEPLEVTDCKSTNLYGGRGIPAATYTCNGWVSPLAGGHWSGLGGTIGVSNGMVLGTHIYGYLHNESILVPRYAVTLQAERIDEAEYDRLGERDEHVGRIPADLADEPDLAYWKNLSIREVRKLDFEEPGISGAIDITLTGQERVDAFQDAARSYVTRQRFEQAKKILTTIPIGADRWEVIQALGGYFRTWSWGRGYYLHMDGLLNFGELRINEATEDGFFKVWPFGYMEQVEAVPQLDLIFKNDKVFKLVPHAPKEKLRSYFLNEDARSK